MAEHIARSDAPHGAPRRYQNHIIVGIFAMLVPTAMALVQYKIPTIMVPLMEAFGIDASGGAWLMSVFVLMLVVMAIPVSLLCQRIGPFKVVLCATVCIAVGSIIGAFAPSYPILLASRAIEGTAACAAAVTGPVIIESCVNPQRVGTAMGIWGTWGSLGATFSALLTPAVYNSMGMTFLWLLDAVIVILCTVLLFVIVKDPTHYNDSRAKGGARSVASAHSGAGQGGSEASVPGAGVGAPVRFSTNDGYKPRYRDLLHRDCILVFLGFAAFNVSLLAVLSFVPTLLQLQGMDETLSGFASTLAVMLSIISSPVVGALSDRTGKTRLLLVITTALLGPCVLLMYTHSDWVLWAAALLMGLVAMGCSGICVVALMRALPYPSLKTKAMGALVTLQGVGSFVGTALVQALLGPDFSNVLVAGTVVCAICLGGAACYALCKRIDGMPQRKSKEGDGQVKETA